MAWVDSYKQGDKKKRSCSPQRTRTRAKRLRRKDRATFILRARAFR